MGDVVKFPKLDCTSGTAVCMDCRHEWEAVAPNGTEFLECPACNLVRGRWKYQYEHQLKHFECNCGNYLFHITPDGPYCPNCGSWLRPWD